MFNALGKNHTYGIAVTVDGIMYATTVIAIILMWVLNVTDVSSIQQTVISLDKKDTGLETSMNFSVLMCEFQ